MAEIDDDVYYKKEKENRKWRGPRKVIEKNEKVVLVKQGGTLRKIT